MVKYQYNALKNGKEVIKGEIEAKTPREARDGIRALGYTPLEIFQPDLVSHELENESDNQGGITFLSLSDKILFISELQVMISSGISILEALQTIQAHSPKQKLKRIVESNKFFFNPMADNVALTAGLLEEQALPADT